MLEWTICSDCGKILDNSQETCQSCQSDVDKIHMDYLTPYLTNLNFLVSTISVFRPSIPEDIKGLSVEDMIANDLLRYFSYLAMGDGKITDNELEFINELLGFDYSREDITGRAEIEDFPMSFQCLLELDSYGQAMNMHELISANELFGCYKLFGKFFITADNELDEKVLKL